jgi:predicted helicase
MQHYLSNYLASLNLSDCLNQTEHTGRAFLQNLLNQTLQHFGLVNLTITHEGKRNKDGFGAPDFTVSNHKTGTIIGYIENKKIDENLNKILKSEQIQKYQKLSQNIILTDYLNWIWLYKNNQPLEFRLCTSLDLTCKNFKISVSKAQEFADFLNKFLACEPQQITTTCDLAQKLARPTIELKNYLTYQIEQQIHDLQEKDQLFALYQVFQTSLFTENLSAKEFADGFAQMLTYSIFLARLNSGEVFSLQNIKNHIPHAFSLIKTLSGFFDLLNNQQYQQINWAVENILSVINNLNLAEVVLDMQSHASAEKDPYIYFYEDFLKEYDMQSKVNRGVYYTPPAVVKFIIEAVSQILQDDFNLPGGLANQQVKVLDFACGTGGFLFEAYTKVLAGSLANSLQQNELINHLLNNFYGFEIMIASYIISHLKLSQFLKEQGYNIASKNNKRIGVYLTNTLENNQNIQTNFFAKELAEEAKKAKEIKEDKQIIAIIGNPPYNVSSQNSLEINQKLKDFHNNYKPKDEQKINIDDDYIKFIAFAHQKIVLAGSGIVGVIVNNSFLKGLTHRKMRNELLKDFEKIYIIDLHGNARIKETSPTGGIDQNVFDIMQGVCILLLIKNSSMPQKGVYLLDLWGKRSEKLKILPQINLTQLPKLDIASFNQAFRSTKWGANRFIDDLSFFSANKQETAMLEYGDFWGITDIFNEFGSGVKTERDDITICFNKKECQIVVNDFNDLAENKIREKYLYNPKNNIYHEDSRDWQVLKAKQDIQNNYNQDFYQTINYRPFDDRITFYTGTTKGFIGTPGFSMMKNMLQGENIGLVFERIIGLNDWNHIFITNRISDIHLTGSKSSFAPLYVYKSEKQLIAEQIATLKKNKTASKLNTKQQIGKLNLQLATASEQLQQVVNFQPQFSQMLAEKFNNPSPKQVLAFIYASMHSSHYRSKFLELLKIDFPRINFAVSLSHFQSLAKLGEQLLNYHLLHAIPTNKAGECFCDKGFDNVLVKKPQNGKWYDKQEQKLYLNQDCYFKEVIYEVYEFKIGGYQVLDKYIKSRVERVLDVAEIKQISNIIKVITATLEIIRQIDLLDSKI